MAVSRGFSDLEQFIALRSKYEVRLRQGRCVSKDSMQRPDWTALTDTEML